MEKERRPVTDTSPCRPPCRPHPSTGTLMMSPLCYPPPDSGNIEPGADRTSMRWPWTETWRGTTPPLPQSDRPRSSSDIKRKVLKPFLPPHVIHTKAVAHPPQTVLPVQGHPQQWLILTIASGIFRKDSRTTRDIFHWMTQMPWQFSLNRQIST